MTNMTDIELYNKAKEAYYNGEPIMTDYEFDELEKKLGLENKSLWQHYLRRCQFAGSTSLPQQVSLCN